MPMAMLGMEGQQHGDADAEGTGQLFLEDQDPLQGALAAAVPEAQEQEANPRQGNGGQGDLQVAGNVVENIHPCHR